MGRIESESQKERRLQKRREKYRENCKNETAQQKEARLEKVRTARKARESKNPSIREKRLKMLKEKYEEKIENETDQQREIRRQKNRESLERFRLSLSQSQQELIRQKDRERNKDKYSELIEIETEEDYEQRLQRNRESQASHRASLTQSQKEVQLEKQRQRDTEFRNNESQSQREVRLQIRRTQEQRQRENETEEERLERQMNNTISQMLNRALEDAEAKEARLQANREKYAAMKSKIDNFQKEINVYADHNCEVCTKTCYPNQVVKYTMPEAPPNYLPNELKKKPLLVLCHTCKSHLSNKNKLTHPPKAYWNRLEPGEIPACIQVLTKSEIGLLSRIHAYIKVIKFDGRFGQYGFKGLATLFAKDIFEVTEKVDVLPRASNDTNIIIVTEELENLNIIKEYKIDRTRLYTALHWLVNNNTLYSDVKIDNDVHIDENDLIRAAQPVQDSQQAQPQIQQAQPQQAPKKNTTYGYIGPVSRIIRASYNQGDNDAFESRYAGVQCCAMALAAIVRAQLSPPSEWKRDVLNDILMFGDEFYSSVRALENEPLAYPISDDGYLLVRNFDVLKRDFIMYNEVFGIEYDDDPPYFGILDDKSNGEIGMSLLDSLTVLFELHIAGILITNSKSYAVMNIEEKYYFADSHSCGEKGAPANSGKGKACVIECDNIVELVRIIKRTTGSSKTQYTLDYIDVLHTVNAIAPESQEDRHMLDVVPIEEEHNDQMEIDEVIQEIEPDQNIPDVEMEIAQEKEMLQTDQEIQMEEQNNQIEDNIEIPLQTSAMMHQDYPQMDVDQVFDINADKIMRKTTDNLVNINRELRAEELSWWFLLPYGINGLKEVREVTMTPLQYFQFRILGGDTRFQRNDYLFYATALYEFFKVQSTVNACARKIEGKNGAPEDIHTYLKNMRGTGAYWNTALYELLDIIKNLGPPHYFVTLSCNDLNWIDMKKALLIADGNPDKDPNSINQQDAQRLIELYPAVVSRHFSFRVSKFMEFLKHNEEIFGGKLEHFWWRVEFQNRGSPHVHLVVWIEDHPEFDSEEGIERIDEVVTCHLPDSGTPLRDIVEKCQRHHHTATCYKGDNPKFCRFRFPRPVAKETTVIATSTAEFTRNGGRICNLKRTENEKWINNYNRIMLEAWQGNIDIQPVGDNDAIAYYIAKYVAKSEPTDLQQSIGQAIKQIREEDTDIAHKMFKICIAMQKHRQVSACECIYRLCHLKMRDSNIPTVYANTRKSEDRYRLIKFGANNEGCGYCSNIIERYEARPDQHNDYDFQNMSLTEFAMFFEPYYNSRFDDEEENVDKDIDGDENEKRGKIKLIRLKDESAMKIRNKRAVVRVPRFSCDKDPESYYYSLLMQYKPFRQESELLQCFESAKDAFLACEEELKQKNEFMDIFRRRDKELEQAMTRAHAVLVFDDDVEPVNQENIDDVIDANGEDLMDDQTYQTAIKSMNLKQKELIQLITNYILAQLQSDPNYKPFRIFLTGNAGCGKTFIMKIAQNQAIRLYGNNRAVVLAALTGVAAVLINGATLHSTFKLPVQKDGRSTNCAPLSGNVLQMMRENWKDVKLLIIDEISMVSYRMLTMIESRCRQLKNNENELFGGLNVLVCGDLLQLPPIMGQVFEQPANMIGQTHLWRQFTLCELVDNMRQKGDQTFINILNALRVGELKLNQLKPLQDRIISSDQMTGEFAIGQALRIYPKRSFVDEHNALVLEEYRKKGTEMFKIEAQDRIVNGDPKLTKDMIAAKISTDVNKTAGLPKSITLFVGAKVMLKSNVDVSKKLVNGAIGLVTKIIWPNFRRGQLYDEDIPRVYVNFDGGVGEHLIIPVTKEFQAKGNATAERYMLPLVLSWACTGHKMQGSTLDTEVARLSDLWNCKGLAYVILSRAKSLEGLRIEDLNVTELVGQKPCNLAAKREIERMRAENNRNASQNPAP